MKKKLNIKTLIIFCILLFFLNSCCNSFIPIFGCISETKNPSVSLEELLSVPQEVEIENQKFHLFGSFYRNINCFKLCSFCWGLNLSLGKLPESCKVERVWIINGKKVWEVDLLNPLTSYVENSKGLFISGPNGLSTIIYPIYAVVKIIDKNKRDFFLRSEELGLSDVI